MILSANFGYEEFIFSSTAQRLGINNDPMKNGADFDTLIENFKTTCNGLENVRDIIGGYPIHIDSGYRCPALNNAVGGASDSAHLLGFAADILCQNYGSPDRLFLTLSKAQNNGGLSFDQMIVEGAWLHISFAPTMREQTLIAHFGDKGQKTSYSVGI